MGISIEEYKQARSELVEQFSPLERRGDLLNWVMLNARITARNIDLLEAGARSAPGDGELNLTAAKPDLIADVLEEILKLDGYPIMPGEAAWYDL